MDPNATLARLRDLLGEHDKPISVDEIDEVSTLFEALDDWMSDGNFPPTAWRAWTTGEYR